MTKILKGTTKTVRSLERRTVKNVKGVGLDGHLRVLPTTQNTYSVVKLAPFY